MKSLFALLLVCMLAFLVHPVVAGDSHSPPGINQVSFSITQPDQAIIAYVSIVPAADIGAIMYETRSTQLESLIIWYPFISKPPDLGLNLSCLINTTTDPPEPLNWLTQKTQWRLKSTLDVNSTRFNRTYCTVLRT